MYNAMEMTSRSGNGQLGVFYTIIVHSIGMDFIGSINYRPSWSIKFVG